MAVQFIVKPVERYEFTLEIKRHPLWKACAYIYYYTRNKWVGSRGIFKLYINGELSSQITLSEVI